MDADPKAACPVCGRLVTTFPPRNPTVRPQPKLHLHRGAVGRARIGRTEQWCAGSFQHAEVEGR